MAHEFCGNENGKGVAFDHPASILCNGGAKMSGQMAGKKYSWVENNPK
jgi:hypothetical protein